MVEVFFFSAFRLLFLSLNSEKIMNDRFLSESLFMGFQFDTMVVSYFILPVFVFSWIAFFLNRQRIWHFRAFNIYFLVVTLISILICTADIPYYKYFSSRLTSSVHMWMENPLQMFRFIFSDPQFYPFIVMFLVTSTLAIIGLTKMRRSLSFSYETEKRLVYGIIYFFLTALILILGTRGTFKLRPLMLKDAFISNNAFINQLSINPVHSYFDSYRAFKINVLEESVALETVKRTLKSGAFREYPLARKVIPDTLFSKRNVVLILMESLTADVMSFKGKRKGLTPFLDSLSTRSLFYSNAYTAGIHTCNGVYSSLYGLPGIMAEHPMANISAISQKFSGLPVTLRDHSYNTLFFCTHEDEFDNLGFFLRNNGMRKVFSKKDYPSKEFANTWGISDEYLFEFGIKTLSLTKEPFFATLLTISTHAPHDLPEKTKFKATAQDKFGQVYQYSDWALKKFFTMASKQKWFNNTVFILMGDHGISMEKSRFDAPLSLNHSPLIIYDPSATIIKKPATISSPAMQIDIFPTTMGILKLPYINNSAGIDLQKEKREFAYFSQDNRLCSIGEGFYFVSRKNGEESLYRTADVIPLDVLQDYSSQADRMKTYAYSMLQTVQKVLDEKKAGPVILK